MAKTCVSDVTPREENLGRASSLRRILFIAPLALGPMLLAGCTSNLELHYGAYSDLGAGKQVTAAEIMKAATSGSQILTLPRSNIFLVPTASLSSTSVKDGASTPAQAAPTQPAAAQRQNIAAAALPANAAKGKKGAAPATPPGGLATTQGAASSVNSATDSTGKAAAAAQQTLLNPLATANIDGVSWSVIVVPVVDDATYFTVKATNNLLITDTLAVDHPSNSDVVSGLNSKSVNNTASVIETSASVVGAILPIVGLAASAMPPSQNPKADPLKPTWFRVPDNGFQTPLPIPSVPSWFYSLDWTPPVGAVTFDQFMGGVSGKSVAIYPVPACISGSLKIYHKTVVGADPGTTATPDATFFITIETPNSIRPVQVPATGSVTMGSVCGATAADSSTSASDTTQAIVKALSSAATTINGAVNKQANSNDNTKPAAAGSTSTANKKS